MSISTLEMLPVDILFEMFGYLSPRDVLQSFVSLNKYFRRIIVHEYLWHIQIGDSPISLSMFNDFCQNVLRLIGARVVSLRVVLSDVIGGWSIVSSSLRHDQVTLLQCLHLIDIKPHEFDKVLRSHLVKQLRTLIVDLTGRGSFEYETVEGGYLAKVCSKLPLLTICRLPFNRNHRCVNQLEKHLLRFPMILPNFSETTHLRTLTIGVHTLHFLERLLSRIPLIEDLSIGLSTFSTKASAEHATIPLPADADLLRNLSRLRLNCRNNLAFHQAMALFSSVFGQLSHLSLKLSAWTFVSDPFSVSSDTIERFCIARLRPCATYALHLYFRVKNDLEEKFLFNGFLTGPIVHRKRPKVYIQECSNCNEGPDYHCFLVFTSYKETTLPTILFSDTLRRSWKMSVNPRKLFPRANEFMLCGYKKQNHLSELINSASSTSSMIPWALFKKLTIDEGDVVSAKTLKSIIQMAPNVDTLQIDDFRENLPRAILRNTDDLGIRLHQQVKSLILNDITLTLQNAPRFCLLLSNRLPNLRKLSFTISASYYPWRWIPSRIIDGKNKSTKRLARLIYYLIDHLQQLTSLDMIFHDMHVAETPCFPNLIRRQFHQYPLSRPYRFRCTSTRIQIWL